jgi:ankyrin repeat protein
MCGFGRLLGAAVSLAIAATAMTGCRKPDEAKKSDLKEAGYSMTTADWLRASSVDDVVALKKFVGAGFDVGSRDEAGDSALHAAAAGGAENAADFLLDRGLSVDLRGAAERTPLMAAVLADQTSMVRWLLRQGADPRLKDKDGFSPMMLAVREGKSGPVEEIAPYHRDSLDSALLLAALVGQTEVIDTLTNYGASVYARMEDGRTPLMIAAENGHTGSVELLLDIGSSRFSTDAEGRTATELANAAGHMEIAALIDRDPLPGELALETPEEIAESMDAFVVSATEDPASSESGNAGDSQSEPASSPARPIDGEVLSAAVAENDTAPQSQAPPAAAKPFPLPPIVMRHYREREVPVRVRSVQGETATLEIEGARDREITVRAGEQIPDSRLIVLRVQRRMEESKLTQETPAEISIVEVRDTASGSTREWISGVPASAHDPVALIEDAATGRRYTATPGQRFTSADGAEFVIADVRPNQLVIKDAATGAVQTLPLRGPRG